MIALWLCLTLLTGITVGYVVAASRTDRLLARMSDDELKALARRVRRRRE